VLPRRKLQAAGEKSLSQSRLQARGKAGSWLIVVLLELKYQSQIVVR
jgi:hypothetical protein